MSMRYASRRSESAGTRNRRLVIGTVAVSTPALSCKPTEISLARLSPTPKEDDGWWRYRQAVGTKAERRAAREHVTAYHEARLGELIEYITAAVDRYRAGEIDAYDVDEAIHHYHRAARELWKFCWSRWRWNTHRDHRSRPRSDGHRWRIHQLVGPGRAAPAGLISARAVPMTHIRKRACHL